MFPCRVVCICVCDSRLLQISHLFFTPNRVNGRGTVKAVCAFFCAFRLVDTIEFGILHYSNPDDFPCLILATLYQPFPHQTHRHDTPRLQILCCNYVVVLRLRFRLFSVSLSPLVAIISIPIWDYSSQTNAIYSLCNTPLSIRSPPPYKRLRISSNGSSFHRVAQTLRSKYPKWKTYFLFGFPSSYI